MPDLEIAIDAEVPMATEKAAPFSVTIDPNKPPGTFFRDYKPGKNKIAQLEAAGVLTKRKVKNDIPVGRPIVEAGVDYRSAKDTMKVNDRRKKRIMELAKRYFVEETTFRDKWKVAKRIKTAATDKQLANPGNDLTKALRIMKRTAPLSKQQCIDKAAKVVTADLDARR